MTKKKLIPAIICGGENGRAVVFGYLDGPKLPDRDQPVRIQDARMILRWDDECGGLFGLAANGPKGDTRITARIDEVVDICRQALTVSSHAAKELIKWPAYR